MRSTAARAVSVAAAAALSLFGGASAAKPMHIMSINVCTDLLLLQMVPKSRIASVSYLAHDAVDSLFPGADKGVAINHGAAEDIINQRPDLILASDNSTPVTRRLVTEALHTPLVQVMAADNFAQIRASIRQVGAAVGESGRAEALIRAMDATLAHIHDTPLPKRMRVVAWSGGDSVPGTESLTNAIIDAAGAVNIAAQQGANDASFDVEQLLYAHPDALLYAASWYDEPSLRSDEGQLPVVRALYGHRRIAYNEVAASCGLPQSADSALAIHRALSALSRETRAR